MMKIMKVTTEENNLKEKLNILNIGDIEIENENNPNFEKILIWNVYDKVVYVKMGDNKRKIVSKLSGNSIEKFICI